MFKQSAQAVTAAAWLVLTPVSATDPAAVADPALAGWIQEVIMQNPTFQAARAAVDAAAGRQRAASQPLFNPELAFEYEHSDTTTTAGGIDQSIDWSDKRRARTAVAELQLQAAGATLRSSRQLLATDLLRVLADWQTAAAIVGASEQQQMLMTRFVDIAEQRRKAGDLGKVELDLAHLAAADADFQLANAGEDLIRARQAVTALTGSAARAWPRYPLLPDLDPQQLEVERLLDELPSMQEAQARVAAGRAAVRLATLETHPDPSLGLRVGKEDSDTLTGISVSIPLFVRNNFHAEVEVANAELVLAEREAANLRQQARAGLIAAAQIYRNASLAWKSWEASGAPRLSQRTDLLNRLWLAGELDTTDYLVQLKQALDTEVSAIEQRGRMWRAWADWLAASGQADHWLNLAGDTP